MSNRKTFILVCGYKTIFLSPADDKKELEDTKKRYNELSEKLMEKNRQYLKLQVNDFVCSLVSHSLWFYDVSALIGRLVFCAKPC